MNQPINSLQKNKSGEPNILNNLATVLHQHQNNNNHHKKDAQQLQDGRETLLKIMLPNVARAILAQLSAKSSLGWSPSVTGGQRQAASIFSLLGIWAEEQQDRKNRLLRKIEGSTE